MAAFLVLGLGPAIRFNLTFLSYFGMIFYHHLALGCSRPADGLPFLELMMKNPYWLFLFVLVPCLRLRKSLPEVGVVSDYRYNGVSQTGTKSRRAGGAELQPR